MEMVELREKYIARLLNEPQRHGFTEIKLFNTPQVTVSRWVRQRCWYLCKAAGESSTTPPATPDGESTRLTLEEYKFGVVLRREVPFAEMEQDAAAVWLAFQNSLVEVENQAFVRGYGKAFAIASGNCLFCHHDDRFRPCDFPGKRRPTLESIGVNLYDSFAQMAWEDYLLRGPGEPFQLFALVLLE